MTIGRTQLDFFVKTELFGAGAAGAASPQPAGLLTATAFGSAAGNIDSAELRVSRFTSADGKPRSEEPSVETVW